MARANTNTEVFNQLEEAGYIRDKSGGASTTLSAATAVGAVSITVASATGIAVGDLIRIGTGNLLEENIVGSTYTTGTTIPLAMPAVYAHAIGEACVEREKVDTGEVTTEGVKVSTTPNFTDVKTATTRGTYVRLLTDADFQFNWSVVNMSLDNAATAHGIAETAITGAGTTISPYRLAITTQSLMALQNVSVYMVGTLYNGRRHELQGWNADLTPTGDRMFTSGQGSPIAFAANVRAVVELEYP